MTKFLKDESLTKKIESTQDIVDAIHRRQLMANENKIFIKHFFSIYFARYVKFGVGQQVRLFQSFQLKLSPNHFDDVSF